MFEKLVEVICNYVEVEPADVKEESRFMEDLGFTSFDFMSMLGELEEELDVEINEQEAADIRTVKEAADYLEKLSQEQ
ncbi:MAG: acyl carrier protein [Firmicutes bacterium]|nr:acyl carrier protein [Blautia sp.]MDD7371991.1 acyl carrier protein [Bacillota bacterium]MDY3714123.1 acyl carrier protein [Blautia sp.]